MENKLDVVICVRDREQDRAERCVRWLRKCDNIKNIFVVDNSIKKPLTEIEGAELIRLEYDGLWNKSWVLNRGIKLCKSKYIMTIDVDILLSESILNKIIKFLDENTLIFNKNIKRIKQFNVSEDYEDMLKKSEPWFTDPIKNLYNEANGGIQVMPLEWIKSVNGYDENAGLLWGGMDNRIWEQALMDKKVVINLNDPMLHVEHINKEENLDEDTRRFGTMCRNLKKLYLNSKIRGNSIKNETLWGDKIPNDGFMHWLTQNELDKEDAYLMKETQKYSSLGFDYFLYNNIPVKIEKDDKSMPSNN